jgi:hypothetical protein
VKHIEIYDGEPRIYTVNPRKVTYIDHDRRQIHFDNTQITLSPDAFALFLVDWDNRDSTHYIRKVPDWTPVEPGGPEGTD